MKKILSVVFVLILFNLPCFSVITPEEEISQEYMQNHGYSYEAARLIDLQNTRINGAKTTYKSKDPTWYTTNKPVSFVRKVFMYFDCGLDDGNFGRNNIDYTPRWDDL